MSPFHRIISTAMFTVCGVLVLGDALAVCEGPGAVDSDGDGVCDSVDNCPYAFNPGQEDSNNDDVCQCALTPEACDDQNGCTIDYCDTESGYCYSYPINGSDGNPCTIDSCDPATGMINHVPGYEGEECEDGMSCSTEGHCASGVCEGTPHAPPEVVHLVFPSRPTLSWDAVPDENPDAIYSVLRGVLSELPTGSGESEDCVDYFEQNTSHDDATTPPPGTGFWYLIRSWNFCAYGSWGAASNGTPRTPTACN